MSVKDFFKTGDGINVIVPAKSLVDLASATEEAPEYLSAHIEEKERLIPHVDYSSASSFARYGSAEQYYEDSISRIYKTYPYDGSLTEKTEWHNNSSYIDKYLFDKEYPRRNGYAILSVDGWGTLSGSLKEGYGSPGSSDLEYIQIKGGPNADPNETKMVKAFPGLHDGDANFYDTATRRESNLKFNASNGVSVEFWLKKPAFANAKTEKEVLFDLWNGYASSSICYGRLTIELSGVASGSPFLVTVQSGTDGYFQQQIGSSPTTASLATWNHYAFTFNSSSSDVETKFYVAGTLEQTLNTGTSINEVTGSLIANIGGLRTAPSGNLFFNEAQNTDEMEGFGKLSGSIDEFRYWTAKRTSEEIGRHWFSQVGGGTNTDVAVSGVLTNKYHKDNPVSLGVYYKFNEGITLTSSVDSTVLDYSGRVSNGSWTGYVDESSRSTGSAMVDAEVASREFKDPIIYSHHRDVSNLMTRLKSSGSDHDNNNSTSIYYSLPAWITEEDEDAQVTKKLVQILSSYFDTLHLQIGALTKFKNVDYASGSYKPFPFSDKLLNDYGFVTNDILSQVTDLETLVSRDEDREFSQKLYDIKNLIYKNIYNNITYIYKSKGTEKSFRNLIRCFGIDDELVRFNIYGDNIVHTLRDNYRSTSYRKKYVSFSHPDRFNATVYQSASTDTNSALSYISGSDTAASSSAAEYFLPWTAEVEAIFPSKVSAGQSGYYSTSFVSSSLFGVHEAGEDSAEFTWQRGEAATATITITDYTELNAGDKVNLVATDGTNYDFEQGDQSSVNGTFEATTSNNQTATNLMNVINTSSGPAGTRFTATVDGAVVTVTQATIGTAGNTTVSLTDSGTAGMSKTNFTGGNDGDNNNFQVYITREQKESTRARFVLSSSLSGFPTLSSSLFDDVYENQKWTLAVRYYVDKTNNGGLTKGGKLNDIVQDSAVKTTPYIEFYGVNTILDQVVNEFNVSGALTVSDATGFSNTANKRFYMGAHRTHFTGAVLAQSDAKISSLRYWKSYLSDNAIRAHSRDAANFGTERPYENIGFLKTSLSETYVPSMDSLALHWNFDTVTGSDSSGDFIVQDYSSGSTDLTSRYGWLGNVVKNQHVGRGANFPASSTASISTEFVYSAKQRLPETINSDDMINILSRDDEYFTRESRPIRYKYAIEKSMYQTISEEMINLFATIVDFNNLIGEPVNRYRQDYKDMGKIRQLFYERIKNTPSLEKYIRLYKWIDSSIAGMLYQLMPASSNASDKIRNIVESHILERNKYWTKFPTLEFKESIPEAGLRGLAELTYDWEHGHAPLNGLQSTNRFWWQERAAATNSNITSGDATIDERRNLYNAADIHRSGSGPNLSSPDDGSYVGSVYALNRFSKVYEINAGTDTPGFVTRKAHHPTQHRFLYGGTNFHVAKKLGYAGLATQPFGDLTVIESSPGSGIFLTASVNYLLIEAGDYSSASADNDVIFPNEKKKVHFKARNSREFSLGGGYDTAKGDIFLPFNIHSSSVVTGYASEISASKFGSSLAGPVDFTNIHVDAYGSANGTPMQTTFTEKFVGGRQHRHLPSYNVSSSRNPETNGLDNQSDRPEAWYIILGDGDPVFGIIGATYTSTGEYDKDTPRATMARAEFAKRPINVRNIQQTTASAKDVDVKEVYDRIGTYEFNWNVVSTTGRTQNNAFFKDNDGVTLPPKLANALPATTHAHSLVAVAASGSPGNIFGALPTHSEYPGLVSNRFDSGSAGTLFTLPRRDLTGSNSVIVSRFSAPGGPEINSRGFLDIMAEEYSVHNALPFRNLSVRSSGSGEDGTIRMSIEGTSSITSLRDREGLRTRLTRRCGRFGFDAQWGSIDWREESADEVASFHKVNRNPIKRIKET